MSKNLPVTAFLVTKQMREGCFADSDIERLLRFSRIVDEGRDKLDEETAVRLAHNANALVTCWESPAITPAVLEASDRISIICHSAGSIKTYVDEGAWPIIWDRKITVTTAATALGIGVAEYTLGLIITGLKKVSQLQESVREGQWGEGRDIAMDPFNLTVGVIGAGCCGSHVIKLLGNFDMRVIVYDPYKSADECAALGAEKVELEQLMTISDVITLHAPNTPQNKHLINRELLGKIKDGAVFINTARGMEVDEEALIDELRTGRFYALLDVTDPEPPALDNPLRNMKNVVMTPHIAGHVTNGRKRQGRFAVDELERFFASGKTLYTITAKQLDHIA